MLPILKRTMRIHDQHEKPWGGIYARRLWRWMLLSAAFVSLLSAWVHYHIYMRYTSPITFSDQVLKGAMSTLDREGLDRAVADIKDKEVKFNQYLTQKVDIEDPARW